ncbi:MAG: sulfatase [bacterium]|nr:sulfatase [bacterium]
MASDNDFRSVSRREFLKALSLGAAAAALGPLGLPRGAGAAETAGAGGKRLPNVVFVLADDLGWRDTAPFGSTFYRTPNIDALARRGMMFTSAYAANPYCSPTRASIMTGLWPARLGITWAVCHVPNVVLSAGVEKGARPEFKAIGTTSATRLKLEYTTLAESLKAAGYRTGHFGKWHLGQDPYDPLHQGFDVDVPHYPGPGPAGSYIAPWKFPPELNFTGQPGEHLEDRMSAEAVKFIKENKDRPFFLNYWAFSVHVPLDAKRALIDKYRGLIDPADHQRNPVMAAMIESLDDAVGTLVKTLDEEGLTDDTIFIFTSDNGGDMYDRIENLPPTNNWPLRGGKGNIHEGGTRIPLVVVWPDVVKGGARSGEVVQSIDYYPTILDMLGLKPAAGQKFDGVSVVPALKGGTLGREAIFCLFPHNGPWTGEYPSVYVRKGDWKLIRYFYGGEKQSDGSFAHRYELYNLKWDISERNNLAGEKPELVKELDALIDGYLKDSGAVLPVPNPKYDPAAAADLVDVEAAHMNASYAEPLPLPAAGFKPSKPKKR